MPRNGEQHKPFDREQNHRNTESREARTTAAEMAALMDRLYRRSAMCSRQARRTGLGEEGCCERPDGVGRRGDRESTEWA